MSGTNPHKPENLKPPASQPRGDQPKGELQSNDRANGIDALVLGLFKLKAFKQDVAIDGAHPFAKLPKDISDSVRNLFSWVGGDIETALHLIKTALHYQTDPKRAFLDAVKLSGLLPEIGPLIRKFSTTLQADRKHLLTSLSQSTNEQPLDYLRRHSSATRELGWELAHEMLCQFAAILAADRTSGPALRAFSLLVGSVSASLKEESNRQMFAEHAGLLLLAATEEGTNFSHYSRGKLDAARRDLATEHTVEVEKNLRDTAKTLARSLAEEALTTRDRDPFEYLNTDVIRAFRRLLDSRMPTRHELLSARDLAIQFGNETLGGPARLLLALQFAPEVAPGVKLQKMDSTQTKNFVRVLLMVTSAAIDAELPTLLYEGDDTPPAQRFKAAEVLLNDFFKSNREDSTPTKLRKTSIGQRLAMGIRLLDLFKSEGDNRYNERLALAASALLPLNDLFVKAADFEKFVNELAQNKRFSDRALLELRVFLLTVVGRKAFDGNPLFTIRDATQLTRIVAMIEWILNDAPRREKRTISVISELCELLARSSFKNLKQDLFLTLRLVRSFSRSFGFNPIPATFLAYVACCLKVPINDVLTDFSRSMAASPETANNALAWILPLVDRVHGRSEDSPFMQTLRRTIEFNVSPILLGKRRVTNNFRKKISEDVRLLAAQSLSPDHIWPISPNPAKPSALPAIQFPFDLLARIQRLYAYQMYKFSFVGAPTGSLTPDSRFALRVFRPISPREFVRWCECEREFLISHYGSVESLGPPVLRNPICAELELQLLGVFKPVFREDRGGRAPIPNVAGTEYPNSNAILRGRRFSPPVAQGPTPRAVAEASRYLLALSANLEQASNPPALQAGEIKIDVPSNLSKTVRMPIPIGTRPNSQRLPEELWKTLIESVESGVLAGRAMRGGIFARQWKTVAPYLGFDEQVRTEFKSCNSSESILLRLLSLSHLPPPAVAMVRAGLVSILSDGELPEQFEALGTNELSLANRASVLIETHQAAINRLARFVTSNREQLNTFAWLTAVDWRVGLNHQQILLAAQVMGKASCEQIFEVAQLRHPTRPSGVAPAKTLDLSLYFSKDRPMQLLGNISETCATRVPLPQSDKANMIFVTFLRSGSRLREPAALGGFLLLGGRDTEGLECLILRSFNPREQLLNMVATETLVEATLEQVATFGKALGFKRIICAHDLFVGASVSNRRPVVHYITRTYGNPPLVHLMHPEAGRFNGYPRRIDGDEGSNQVGYHVLRNLT